MNISLPFLQNSILLNILAGFSQAQNKRDNLTMLIAVDPASKVGGILAGLSGALLVKTVFILPVEMKAAIVKPSRGRKSSSLRLLQCLAV